MKKFMQLLILILLLIPPHAYASFDYSSQVLLRSYPLAGSINLVLGKSLLLWGSNSGISYGFIRAAVEGKSSGVGLNRILRSKTNNQQSKEAENEEPVIENENKVEE